MSTVAQPESRTGRWNARALLAGGGATVALIAAAAVAFLAISALVAFDELPIGDDPDQPAAVQLPSPAQARGGEGGSRPTAERERAPQRSEPRQREAAGAEAGQASAPGDDASGGETFVLSAGVGTGPGPEGGALGDTVATIERAARESGVNVPLRDVTGGATGPLDQAVEGLRPKVQAVGGD